MNKIQIAVFTGIIAVMFLYGCGEGDRVTNADSSFTRKQVTVYEKDSSGNTELTCAFRDDMPNVPHVSLEQYLDLIYGEDSDYTLTGSGKHYTVTGKNKNTKKSGSKLKIDTAKETLTFEKYEDFVVGKKDGTMVDYVDMKLVSQKGNPKITYDLSDYGMDILAADGQVFLPLSTLSDILAQSLTFSDYIDGEIYLVRADSSGSDYTSHTQDKVNAYFEILSREADVASYAYNELCFVLDNLYGRPERAQSQEFVNSLATIGLDETLEKGGTLNGIDLKKMKTYLTSTNKAEYAQGLVMLDNLLFDGGHTLFSSPYIFRFLADENLDRTELSRGYKVILDEDPDAKNTANHFLDLFENVLVTGNELRSLRQEGFGTASKVWENDNGEEISSIYLFDNTAIFRFDEFKDDVIRTSSGTRPLQEALEYAKENNCDNFVLDLSTNGGGSDQTMGYILSMIFEEDAVFYHYDVNTGARRVEVFTADKNLDGTKDEKDAEVKYGFHYAVMMSRYTYSCGNFASILAKEHGIPLLGENSGGGGCLVTMHGFPDECDSYQISSSIGMSDSSNQSADSGASPDYPMAVYPEDGGDMPSLYDPAEIVGIVNGHYQ